MSKTTDKICENCHFWVRWQKQPDPSITVGQCRKNPPADHMRPDGRMKTHWPCTQSTDFCGKFKHRDNQNNAVPA